MSNYFTLDLEGGKTLELCFGMVATEEFVRVVSEQTKPVDGEEDSPIVNGGTIATINIVYCGAYNACVNNRKRPVPYKIIAEIVETLYDTPEGISQIAEMYELYNESRFGRNVATITDGIKKKQAEESQSPSTGQPQESMLTAI
jgi:hypothetical protein